MQSPPPSMATSATSARRSARVSRISNSGNNNKSALPTSTRRKASLGAGARNRELFLNKADIPIRRWTRVLRPPQEGVGFKTLKWVPIEKLTASEKEAYDEVERQKKEAEAEIERKRKERKNTEIISNQDSTKGQNAHDAVEKMDQSGVSLSVTKNETSESSVTMKEENMESSDAKRSECADANIATQITQSIPHNDANMVNIDENESLIGSIKNEQKETIRKPNEQTTSCEGKVKENLKKEGEITSDNTRSDSKRSQDQLEISPKLTSLNENDQSEDPDISPKRLKTT